MPYEMPFYYLMRTRRLYSSYAMNVLLMVMFFGGIGVLVIFGLDLDPELRLPVIVALLGFAALNSLILLVMQGFSAGRAFRQVVNRKGAACWPIPVADMAKFEADYPLLVIKPTHSWATFVVALFLGGAIAAMGLIGEMPDQMRRFMPLLGTFMALLVIAYSLISLARQRWLEARRIRQYAANPAPRIAIHRRGMAHEIEGYYPLSGFRSVRKDGGNPPRLVFHVEVASRYTRTRYDITVPVPRGHEDEADALVERLSAHRGR